MHKVLPLLLTLAVLPLGRVDATLIDYYSLNDANTTAGGGRTDTSGSGLGGGDLINTNGTGATSVISGKIGGALSFPNSLNYTSDAIASIAFPSSLSIWVNTTETANVTDKALGIEDQAATDRDMSLAVVNANRAGAQVARNTGSPDLALGSTNIADASWHLLTGVFTDATTRVFYLDGKFASTRSVSEALWANNSTTRVNVGGFMRSSGLVDQFNGGLDDAGYFDNGLVAADAALIFGLGQTGGIGLSQLALAQTLNTAAVGSSSTFGGATWYKVSGLSGATGDFGGTVAGGNAFIVTDGAAGLGLSLIPEPGPAALLCTTLLFGAFRRRTTAAGAQRAGSV